MWAILFFQTHLRERDTLFAFRESSMSFFNPKHDELVCRNANLRNDACTYRHKITESLGGFKYVMDPIYGENPERCFVDSSTVRLGRYGVATCDPDERIDIDSAIRLGITRKLSKCPSNQLNERDEKLCSLTQSKPCQHLGAEYNRLLNPPCTLRGRSTDPIFERNSSVYLLPCVAKEAMRSVELPFANNVSNRLLVKDMHRPCIGTYHISSPSGIVKPAGSFRSKDGSVACAHSGATAPSAGLAPTLHQLNSGTPRG